MNAFDKLETVEMFRTFQGEGTSLGKIAVFLRLRRCNLHCKFSGGSICDAFYTWLPGDLTYEHGYKTLLVNEVVDELTRLTQPRADLFVISGGEPLLWKNQIHTLALRLPPLPIEIETNGTIFPGELAQENSVCFNVSPKLSSSGNAGLSTIRPVVLKQFSDLATKKRAVFKFVVTRDFWEQDLAEIEALEKKYGLSSIYVMPEGITGEQITTGMKKLAQPALDRGYRLTTRLHIYIWGNERSR